MSGWSSHLVIAPIVLPLIAGASMLFVDERRRSLRGAISLLAALAVIAAGIRLLSAAGAGGSLHVYRLGDWPAPFAIVLVLDRLSALMVVLAGVLALASLVYSLARWHRAGVNFHPLLQFLLMGLNGTFLTGDLFNLFVFFEVTLAASYGLVLFGVGIARIKAGMHYIVVNLAASFLFLLGVSLIYAVAGTLNMADLAMRVPGIAAGDRVLFETGAALLGIAFVIKAGMWPLCLWLPPAYAAAAPPVAAIFAILTKMGVYVVLRLSLLLFGGDGGPAGFGSELLLYGGMATLAFGIMGVLAAQDTARIAAFAVLVSSGTLLAAAGTNRVDVTAGALFYLVSSTLAISALFLLIELVERGREYGAHILAVTREAFFGDTEEEVLDDEGEIGIPVPATMAMLGMSFLGCAVLLAGLPPLSGFVAKFALLSGLLQPAGAEGADGATWAFAALVVLSGLAVIIAMAREGIHALWEARSVPRVRVIEMAPVAGLLFLCVALTVRAGPAMTYLEATATALHEPAHYLRDVLATAPAEIRP